MHPARLDFLMIMTKIDGDLVPWKFCISWI